MAVSWPSRAQIVRVCCRSFGPALRSIGLSSSSRHGLASGRAALHFENGLEPLSHGKTTNEPVFVIADGTRSAAAPTPVLDKLLTIFQLGGVLRSRWQTNSVGNLGMGKPRDPGLAVDAVTGRLRFRLAQAFASVVRLDDGVAPTSIVSKRVNVCFFPSRGDSVCIRRRLGTL